MNFKLIVSHNYLPCEAAKEWYKGKSSLVHICSSTSLSKDDYDYWAKDNFISDVDCPKSCPDKNYTMCELTNLYAGASLPEVLSADYIGLCHYRRLFSPQQVQSCIDINKPDIICARAAGMGLVGKWKGIVGQYEVAHVKSDFDDLLDYIKESALHQQKPQTLELWKHMPVLVAPCNCVIMKKEIFLDYIDRMFRVLFDIYDKKKAEIDLRDSYQRRAVGFLGERYTSWYVTAQHFLGKQVEELPLEVHEDWKPLTATDNRKS